jgi:hypothetical protein
METMRKLAEQFGFRFQPLNWRHQRGLIFTLFAKPGFDTTWFDDDNLTWNRRLETDPAY